MENENLLKAVAPLFNLMEFIQNRGIEDFAKMHSVCLAEHFECTNGYIQEKYAIATRSFLTWFKGLDEDRKIRFMNFANNFYNNWN